MGYRTNVAFCVKPGICVPKFEDVEDIFDGIVRNEKGTLYISEDVKWYNTSSDNKVDVVKDVEDFLKTINEDDYLFVEVDTNQDGTDRTNGSWWDNDFNLCIVHHLGYDLG